MALNPSTEAAFVGRITAPDGNYTYGSSKEETGSGNNDGTPYTKRRADDVFGFLQKILVDGSVVPSGAPDNVNTSQYMQALRNIFVAGTLVTTVGDPGSDTNVPSEQAVREAINAIPSQTITREWVRNSTYDTFGSIPVIVNAWAYGDGRLVGVTNANGTDVITSGDNAGSFVSQDLGVFSAWNDVAYGNGKFVMVGSNPSGGTNSEIRESSDGGITWNVRTAPNINKAINAVEYGDDRFMLTSSSGTSELASSTDGITWTDLGGLPSTGTSGKSLAYSRYLKRWVLIASNLSNPFYSDDNGVSWTTGSGGPLGDNTAKVVCAGDGFVTLPANGTATYRSTDGINWTPNVVLPNLFAVEDAKYGDGYVIATGRYNGSENAYMYTNNLGVSWTIVEYGDGVDNFLRGVLYFNGDWITSDAAAFYGIKFQ